jgi:drug/metabolite transporter (DMT)-like permease
MAPPMAADRSSDNVLGGALFMVTAAFFFAAMSAAVKAAAHDLPNAMVVFFRNAVGLVALAPWIARRGVAVLATRRLRDHLIRGLAGLAAMYCFFYAISRIRLADAVLLNYTLPLLLPPIERLWLKETLPRSIWGPLAIGFAGILLILRPGTAVFEPAALVALAAAGFAALAQVGIRRMTRTEPILRIVFYFALIATVVSAVPLPAVWRRPDAGGWAAMIAAGLLATVGQLLLTRAYAAAPAARVGPFLYTSVVFSGLLDWLFWGDLPDLWFVLGGALVVAAAAVALRLRDAPARAIG